MEWNAFERLLTEQAVLMGMHVKSAENEDKSTPGIYMQCSNIACKKLDYSHEFQRCAGCQTGMYCSKTCYKQSWKTIGHSEECGLMQGQKTGLSNVRQRDERFLHYVAVRDIRRHLHGLHVQISRIMTQDPSDCVGFHLDYTISPPYIDTISIKHLASHSPASSKRNARLVRLSKRVLDSVQKGDKTLTLVAVRYPDGEGSGSLCWAVNLSSAVSRAAHRKTGLVERTKRPAGRDKDGNALEVCFDEVDEIVRRVRKIASMAMQEHPWDSKLIEKEMTTIGDADWPFEDGYLV